MALIETGDSSTGVANVDSNFNLKVALPSVKEQAGYVGIAGFADDAGNVRIPVGASSQGLLGTGAVQVDFEQGFSASAISPSIWSQVLGTMTVGVANNSITLNSGNSVASAAVARLVSYRQAKTPRGSDRIIAWRMMLPNLVAGAVTEIGAFVATGVTSPTSGSFFRYGSDGTLRGVSVSVTGTESTTSVIPTPSLNAAHDYVIWIMGKAIVFQIDDVVVGSIPLGITAPSPVTSESSPFCARLYNASATATAQQVYLHRCVGALYGGTYGYDRQFLAALGGDIGSQGVVGAGTGSLANWANSAAPVSATLSNTAAGYTSLGGQFQFTAVSGSETDCALFAFQVPTQTATNQGRTLVVHGVNIGTFNMGAAVATTPTLLQWGIAYDGTAVSLATADSASTKAPRRVPLGCQSLPVGLAVGGSVPDLRVDFRQPLSVNAGNYLHIILKIPVGTATASQIIRGVVSINATWE
jgi:hypothetical protein